MQGDEECKILLDQLRLRLKALVDREHAAVDELEATKKLLLTLQGEYQRSEHNLDISQKMIVKLTTYMKQNCPTHAVYDALEPTRDEREAELFKKLGL